MDNKFDELAKGLARSVTRRGALKKFGLGLAAPALATTMGWLACGRASAQQFSAWSTPVNMGATINTTNTEWHAAISADLLSIFFVSDRPGGLGGTDLWVAHREHANDDWAPAQNLGSNLNTPNDEFTPELSPDGHWLFFSSTGLSNNKHLRIYAAFRDDTQDDLGWGAPVDLGDTVNSSHYTGDPSLFVDPETGVVTLYFARLERNSDDWNIYQSIQQPDGTFGEPVPVVELNTRSRETHPTVRRDGLEVIFVSNRPGSLGGVDLWVSTRATTSDHWSVPVNLGPTVNTEFDDRAPYLSDDGQTLILVSNRPDSLGGTDLYISTRKKL